MHRSLVAVAVLLIGAVSIVFWSKIETIYYKQMGAIALNKGMTELQANPEKGSWRLQQAEDNYLQALRSDSTDTSVYVRLGIETLATGRTEPALDYLTRANKLRPADRLASLWLGVADARVGLTQQAADLYSEAGAFTQLVSFGSQYAGMEDYHAAAIMFRAATKTRPGYAANYRRLGEVEEESGNADEAINAYRAYISLEDTDLIQKYLVEAHVADMQKHWAEAVAAYEKAFDLVSRTAGAEPSVSGVPEQQRTTASLENPELHFRLGVAYAEMGRRDDALKELQETVRLGGNSKWYYRALADAYFDKGDFQSSLAWYRKVLEVDPTDWRATERLQALAAK